MKGLVNLFKEAVYVFRKAFFSVLGIYVGFIVSIVVLGIIAALTFGKGMIATFSTAAANPAAANVMPGQLGLFVLFVFFFIFLTYLIGLWGILVFKNNALRGGSFIKEAFFEACRKFWKVLLLGIVLMFVFGLVMVVLSLLLKKMSILIILPLTIFLMPMLYTMFFALVCEDGKMIDVIKEGFLLGYRNWLRVFGTSFFYMIVFFALLFTIGMGQIFITKVLGWALLGGAIGLSLISCGILFLLASS